MASALSNLSRGDLQKLCTQKKHEGLLPKDTKCNGKTKDLIELLLGLEASQRKIAGNYAENYDTRYEYIGGVAPYLPLNLLIASYAHYPDHPKLKELEDPQGQIWRDRTWLEGALPPVNYPTGGYRYYNLLTTQSLAPWGVISLMDLEKGVSVKTSKKVKLITYLSEIALIRSVDGTVRPHIQVQAIAWTERGLEYLDHQQLLIKATDRLLIEQEIIEGDHWKLKFIPEGQELRSVVACYEGSKSGTKNPLSVAFLTTDGDFYFCKLINGDLKSLKINTNNIKIKSISFIAPCLIAYNNKGKRYFLIPELRTDNVMATYVKAQGLSRIVFFQHTVYPNWGLRKYIKSEGDGKVGYPGMLENVTYFLPDADLVSDLYTKYGVLPRKFLEKGYLLGTNGTLYKYGQKKHTLTKVKWDSRIFDISMIREVTAGIAW